MPNEPEADPTTGAETDDEVELDYRGRGRPKLPPDQKRREKLIIAITSAELKDFMIAAANSEGGPVRVQEWARQVLLKTVKS